MKKILIPQWPLLATVALLAGSTVLGQAQDKPRIAVFSGPTATIQNNEPLVTSNKAREKYGLPLLKDRWGRVLVDYPRPQRLAAPATVYVEMFTAHPLERDVAELYGPPDGYVDAKGNFAKERRAPSDKPVFVVTLKPEDGLYALPYMARQADGSPWDGTTTHPGAPFAEMRQTFVPDASRIFEEIERNGGGIYAKADYDFYRAVPAGGYTKGLPAARRTDVGSGDIPPERPGVDFFGYGPNATAQTRNLMAKAVNVVQAAMASGKYAGGIWLEGSPTVEDTVYWLNLMIDTPRPITGNAAQRNRGIISPDGDANILKSVDYILSKVWAGEDGRNRMGTVLIEDEVIFTSREVQKGDARPGGYEATGGFGGVVGSLVNAPYITFVPTRKHTYRSDVRVTALPAHVTGVLKAEGRLKSVDVTTKDAEGQLIGSAIPKVVIVKGDNWFDDGADAPPADEKGIKGNIEMLLERYPLAGIVGEGLAPYSSMSASMELALAKAPLCGLPVVKTARGNAHGFVAVNPNNLYIEGNNLTTTKARLLLTAALLKYGSLPAAADPDHPTAAEQTAIKEKIKLYQALFQTH
jgi:hypothetical protein